MPSMIDASCPKCGRRFGWCGELRDKPPCPRCGHRDDPAELAAAQAKMDRLKELAVSNPTADLCREQRVQSGLSLRQAAKILGVDPRRLSDVEHGREPLWDELAKAMAEAYGAVDSPSERPVSGTGGEG